MTSYNVNGSRTTAEAAAQSLREAILAGELKPGEKLHQNQVAEMLGVSRTPLRTALSILAQAGLVIYESNKGYRVREYSIEQIRHAYVVRAELEAMACTMAAKNMTAKRTATLQALIDEGDRILAHDTLRPELRTDYRHMNVTFHAHLVDYSGNIWLREMINHIHNVPLVSDRIIIWKDRDIFIRTHDDHRRIADALSRKDGTRAGAIMREHVTFSVEYMLSQIREWGDTEPAHHTGI